MEGLGHALPAHAVLDDEGSGLKSGEPVEGRAAESGRLGATLGQKHCQQASREKGG
jgi:hypothetical protein